LVAADKQEMNIIGSDSIEEERERAF